MKGARIWLAAAAFASACVPARGDGVVLLPSQLLQVFHEQTQLAVVEVRPDRTVRVDLFISLLDASGESHDVPFLLPLQTLPREFRARELTLAQFERSHTKPLNRILDRGAMAERTWETTVWSIYAGSSVLSGPAPAILIGAAPVIFPVFYRGGSAGGASPITPALSVATEHVRVGVYAALKPHEVAALAKMAALPSALAGTLDQYAGQPFALVRLRTAPVPAASSGRDYVPPEEHAGVCFTFPQDMLPKGGVPRYDYPLGTGRGWENPIPLTRIYVVAPEDLLLSLTFPPGKWGLDDIADAAGGRQVHVATWRHENPKRDAEIGLRGRGRTSFMIERARRRSAMLICAVSLPVLGFSAWLLMFLALVWTNPYARNLGFSRALWRGWAVAQMVVFLPVAALWALLLLLLSLAMALAGPTPGEPGFWKEVAGLLAIAAGLLAAAFLDYRAVKARLAEARDFVWTSVVASAMAAIAYLAAGAIVVVALGGSLAPFGK